jgi:hypothetical protein
MSLRVLAAVMAILLVSSDTPRHSRASVKVLSDLEVLQGFWVLKTTEWCGLKADQDPTEDENLRRSERLSRRAEERELPIDFSDLRTTLEIEGNTFVYHNGLAVYRGGCIMTNPRTDWTFTLDTSYEPPVMTKRLKEPVIADGDETFYASYSVQGNTLWLGIEESNDPKKLPATFVTDKDEHVVVLMFKREKK